MSNDQSHDPALRTTNAVLDAYDVARRDAAAAAGRPLDRTASPGLHLTGPVVTYVHTSPDGVLRLLHADGVSARFTPERLWHLLVGAYDLHEPEKESHETLVFADHATLSGAVRALENAARKNSTDEVRGAARMLAYRDSLPWSTYTPVLADSLTSRYWLPAGEDTDDLDAWTRAFGLGDPYSIGTLEALVDLAADGVDPGKLITPLVPAEKYGTRAARYTSDYSQCSAFDKSGTVTDAHAALLAVDPLLLERNRLTSDLTEVRVDSIDDAVRLSIVGEPGRLREGSRVIVFDGLHLDNRVELSLKAIHYRRDTLMLTLSKPNQRNERGHVIHSAYSSGSPLYLTPAPLLLFRKAPQNKRWTTEAEPITRPVDIPADIALAGAPVAG